MGRNLVSSSFYPLAPLFFILLLTTVTVSAQTDPRVYFFTENDKFDFIIYNFDQPYSPLSQSSIDPPSGSSQSRTSSYSVNGKSFLTMTLPPSALSISVTFGRGCVLPILTSSTGSNPTVSFVTSNPQEFYFNAVQCGAPGIATRSRNNFGSINPFGYNTYNTVQTDFFQQRISFSYNPNSYPFYIALYCPYFQMGTNSFDMKVTVDFGQSQTTTTSVYDSSGGLSKSDQTLTIGPGQTLSFSVNPTETALSFPTTASLNAWASIVSGSSSSITPTTSSPNRLLATSIQTKNVTSSNGVSSFVFPSTFVSAQVFLQNTDKTSSKTVTLTFITTSASASFPLQYIIIIAVVGTIVIALAVAIPVIVTKARRSKEPRIIYDQRTFVVSSQVIQQDVRLLNSCQMNSSGFKVKEINDQEWTLLNNNGLESPRIDSGALGKEVVAPPIKVYAVDVQAKGKGSHEKNVLANYAERTI